MHKRTSLQKQNDAQTKTRHFDCYQFCVQCSRHVNTLCALVHCWRGQAWRGIVNIVTICWWDREARGTEATIDVIIFLSYNLWKQDKIIDKIIDYNL